MGPSAIRYAGLEERLVSLGYAVRDHGNVETAVAGGDGAPRRARTIPARDQGHVRADRRAVVAEATGAARLRSCSAATTRSRSARSAGSPRCTASGGVLWIDAHSDINTPETSPSGNVHGMALAAALGLAGDVFASDAWPLPAVDREARRAPRRRAARRRRARLLRDAGVRVFTMSEIDRIGVERAVREALDHVSGPGFVHVSLDMDVLDPEIAPGVGTPVRGGLTYREAHLAIELVAESGSPARSRSSR